LKNPQALGLPPGWGLCPPDPMFQAFRLHIKKAPQKIFAFFGKPAVQNASLCNFLIMIPSIGTGLIEAFFQLIKGDQG